MVSYGIFYSRRPVPYDSYTSIIFYINSYLILENNIYLASTLGKAYMQEQENAQQLNQFHIY